MQTRAGGCNRGSSPPSGDTIGIVKRIGVCALPLFLLAALITPGFLFAANEDGEGKNTEEPKTKAASNSDPGEPIARFEVKENPVALEDEVKFDASESSDADGDIAEYAWDLNGNRTFEADGGDEPTIKHSYSRPGEYKVRLRVTGPDGETAVAKLRLVVEEEESAPADEGAAARKSQTDTGSEGGSSGSGDSGKPDSAGSDPSAKSGDDSGGGQATAAASKSVTIKDFSFSPKSVTVNVGDTVTWKNNGPSGHSATAMNGSFDTGILSSGESGSHKFTSPGTVEYICTPHPFMKATVKVSGSGGSGSGGSSSEDSTLTDGSGSDSGSSSDDDSGLPTTGAELATFAALGLGLLGLGLMLRSAAAPSAAGLAGAGPILALGGRVRGATVNPRRLLHRREKASHPEPPAEPPEPEGMRLVRAIRSAARTNGGELRSIVGELFADAPTADIRLLRAGGASAESFHAAEIAPNWDGLDRSQRAARIERFIELQQVFAGAEDMPDTVARTAAAVNTKVILLAWAYDRCYGYVARLLNGSAPAD